ncbi:MAG: DsbE family thiol:disulfide interchange protein [Pseudomonadota bacterium]
MTGRLWRIAPVAVAAVLAAGLWVALRGSGDDPVSPWIGREAPAAPLPPRPDGPAVDIGALTDDGVVVVNFWASWCGPCRVEHPQLQALAGRGVRIVGVEFRDEPDAADQFLRALGDPFHARAADEDGRAGFDWGVTGIPETFVIDADGVVRAHYRGPLSETMLEREVGPLIAQLSGDGA